MKMIVPSGRTYYQDDLDLLAMMVKYGFIRRDDEPFTLNSGIKSHVYVFGREDVTDYPEFEWKLGLKITRIVQKHSRVKDKQPCLIGIPTAGNAIAQAASTVSYRNKITVSGEYICHRVMRQKLKEHGAHPKWVNGDPEPDKHTYWTIDNVVTNGDSKFVANERLLENGYPVDASPSFILVDRQQGGIERMRIAGFRRVVVAYYLLDLTFAFGELGLWPKDTVKAVEKEIEAHQF